MNLCRFALVSQAKHSKTKHARNVENQVSSNFILSQMTEKMLKMYILIRENVQIGISLVAASHASLAAYLKFQESPEIKEWLSGPFYKTICKVSDEEFERAKEFEDSVIITESALHDQEVAIAFKPRKEWPTAFRFYQLYR